MHARLSGTRAVRLSGTANRFLTGTRSTPCPARGAVARSGRFELPTPRFVVWWTLNEINGGSGLGAPLASHRRSGAFGKSDYPERRPTHRAAAAWARAARSIRRLSASGATP